MPRFALALLWLLGPLAALSPMDALAERAGPTLSPTAPFRPTADLDLGHLIDLVGRGSSAIQESLLAVDLAAADVRQSHLLENPLLDASAATLPLGTPNPADLPDPLRQVPNYGVGLSYHLDLLRRGPRQDRAQALLVGTRAQLHLSLRERALGLAQVLAVLATTSLRLEGERGMLEDARGSLSIAQSRAQTGFGTPLEVDRMEIELLRLEQQLRADEGQEAAALASCADYLASPCLAFATPAVARAYLEGWLARAQETQAVSLDDRPDLRALRAQGVAATAEAQIARRSAVPDPTVRVGYLYDNFVVSGNQRHSMAVSLSLPLTVFDHGQAALEAAQARSARVQQQLALTRRAASARIEALRTALTLQIRRKESLQKQAIPRARQILRDANRAFEARALRLTDLIQARRGLDELLLSEAESLNDAVHTALDLTSQIAK